MELGIWPAVSWKDRPQQRAEADTERERVRERERIRGYGRRFCCCDLTKAFKDGEKDIKKC